ncbi:MAG: hypothetical protein IPJ89_00440 [Candidatus Iainarchaeum archaeon]|uniref:Uncharacterized protein n=1 Tax=Candidatus Iainarchaeum sp. TaxID=3101447 RepID=A0A7T9DK30_9ARCH|nr:MAG: hypothetical protein IPJ89_00440 [Candidatus Diapherotrites archaeon]
MPQIPPRRKKQIRWSMRLNRYLDGVNPNGAPLSREAVVLPALVYDLQKEYQLNRRKALRRVLKSARDPRGVRKHARNQKAAARRSAK